MSVFCKQSFLVATYDFILGWAGWLHNKAGSAKGSTPHKTCYISHDRAWGSICSSRFQSCASYSGILLVMMNLNLYTLVPMWNTVLSMAYECKGCWSYSGLFDASAHHRTSAVIEVVKLIFWCCGQLVIVTQETCWLESFSWIWICFGYHCLATVK